MFYNPESRHILTVYLAMQNIEFLEIIVCEDGLIPNLNVFESRKTELRLFFVGCFPELLFDVLKEFKRVVIFDITIRSQVFFLTNIKRRNFDLYLSIDVSTYDLMITYIATKFRIFLRKPWLVEYIDDSFNIPLTLESSLEVNMAIFESKIAIDIEKCFKSGNPFICLEMFNFQTYKQMGLRLVSDMKDQIEEDVKCSKYKELVLRGKTFKIWITNCVKNKNFVALKLYQSLFYPDVICFTSFDRSTKLWTVNMIGLFANILSCELNYGYNFDNSVTMKECEFSHIFG